MGSTLILRIIRIMAATRMITTVLADVFTRSLNPGV